MIPLLRIRGLLAALVGMSVATVVLGPVASAASGLDFTWSAPPLITDHLNGEGLSEYATPLDRLARRRWPLRLTASAPCVPSATYRWRVNERVVRAGTGLCEIEQVFPRQGDYEVQLERKEQYTIEHKAHEVEVRSWLVVALGDSVASGEGNPDMPRRLRKAAVWQDTRCHRSALAGVAQAAATFERARKRTSVTFVDLACSGATITEGLIAAYAGIAPPRGAHRLPAQVSELGGIEAATGSAIDAIIVSVGANDLYFSKIVQFCILRRHCYEKRFSPNRPLLGAASGSRPLTDVVAEALRRLPSEYDRLAASLPSGLSPGRVFLVEYFDPTQTSEGRLCKRVLGGIDETEIAWLDAHLLRPLNQVIHAAADRNGWRLVSGVAAAFRRHGYCAKRQRWLRTLPESLALQNNPDGTLHPDRRGHAAIGRLISAALLAALGQPAISVPARDSDLEPLIPAGGFGGAIVAVGVAGYWRTRRRRAAERKRRRAAASPAATQGTTPVFPPLPANASPGLQMARLLRASHVWIHRRVESVAFTDDTLRRYVSVDFTVPDWLPAPTTGSPRYVPIAVLAKTPLTSFDLRDETGRALPMLTRRQNGRHAVAALVAVLEATLGGAAVPDEIRRRFAQIAIGSQARAGRLAEALRRDTSLPGGALGDSEVTWLLDTFSLGFMVLVQVERPGERRIVKFSYEEQAEVMRTRPALRRRGEPWWRALGNQLAMRLGWRPLYVHFPIADGGAAGSYHFELAVARDQEVIEAELGAASVPRPIRSAPRMLPSRRVHMYLSSPSGVPGLAWAAIRAQRRGMLRGATALSLFTAVLLGVASTATQSIASAPATAGPLLLAAPGLLAAYLSRPDDHPITSRLLVGARVLIAASGLCSFASAAIVALDPSVADLNRWLPFLAVLAFDVFLLLLITCFLPLGPRQPRGVRRHEAS